LLVYWTVVFWGYSSRSERVVLAAAWLLLGVVPEIVSLQRRHMAVTLSSPMRVMENLALSRLEGSTLTDLGELRTRLPDSIAVKQLLADIHQRFGQREFARALYLDVIDAEPDNAEAMINLGAFYYHVGDYASAIQHFQRASGKDALAAVANFNLGQAYSASYLFTQSEQALRAAQQLDPAGVSRWIDRTATERIITVDGGIRRRQEIDRQLRVAWNPAERPPSLVARFATSGSMRLALFAAALAVGLEALGRRRGFYASPQTAPSPRSADAGSRPVSLAAVLIPGVDTVRSADGYRTVAALLLPVALLTLPLVTLLGYRVPWGYDPGSFLAWGVAGFGLLAYLSRRVIRGLRA
jgi:tetratricopeptide (TPR) repeat protein